MFLRSSNVAEQNGGFGKWGVFDCTVFMPKIKVSGRSWGSAVPIADFLCVYHGDYDAVIKLQRASESYLNAPSKTSM